MPWLVLVVAGCLEVVWALGLKYTHGFTRPLPSVLTVIAIIGSMWLLGVATKTLPIGTAYAVWVGIGAVGTAIGGMVLLGEPVSLVRIGLLAMLVGAILGLKLTAPALPRCLGVRSWLSMPDPAPLASAGKPAFPADLRWSETQTGDRFRARLGRARAPAVGLFAFAAAWNGFLLVWYMLLFRGGGPTGVFFWFPLIHVAAGVYITYRAVCLLLNSAHLAFEGTTFSFRWGPLPELGAVRLPVEDLHGFEVRGTRGRDGGNQPDGPWFVLAETKGGDMHRVALDLPSAEQADFVVARLEGALERARHQALEGYRD